MTTSQKLAIAAHVHVLLRRKTGRVTDTEWMAANHEYATEIVRFCRQKAREDKLPELGEWADKLERAVNEPVSTHRPLAQSAMQMLNDRVAAPPATLASVQPPSTGGFGHSTQDDSGFVESTVDDGKPPKPAAPRYVGGIR